MSRIRQIKTTFTSGEISSRLLGRGDLSAYENGALSLRNVFIHPTGGVTRRSGLRYIDTISGNGRLIDFEFNTEQTYLLVLTNLSMDVYQNGAKITTLTTPWTYAQLAQINWTQSADTLLICHPDVEPQKITRSGAGVWTIGAWVYDVNATNAIQQPTYKFAPQLVTLKPSGINGNITLTASVSTFNMDYVGTRIRVEGKEVRITAYASPTVVDAIVIETLPNSNATKNWEEQAFSKTRGWPVSVCFHQDRLVIGGSRDLPNRLWLSKSGGVWNFDLGEGLDDEAIEFSILSDQVNAIRAVFSGRDLQVFTSGAEWQVTGSPLTPSTVQIDRQTRIGSMVERTVPPVDIEGATIFVARNGREVREFLYTDIEAAYQSADLSLLAQHLIKTPIDQAFDKRRRLLHFILQDGTMATLTNYRVEKVSAWTLQNTDGLFQSIVVTGDDVYVLVNRNGQFTIEYFDDAVYLDSTIGGESLTATSIWSGLSYLNGKTVTIIADDIFKGTKIVTGGSITLDEPAHKVEIGLPYTHIIQPLPLSQLSSGGAGRAIRLIEAIFRIENTSALTVDSGRGLYSVPLRDFDESQILDTSIEPASGDISVRAFGWQKDLTQPLWKIEQNIPLPFTLLSVTTELKVND